MVLPMAPFYLVLIAPGINVQSTGGATSGIFSMQYVSRTKPPHSHTFFISVNWHNHSNKLIMSDLVLTKSKSPSMKDRWKDCRYPPPPIWDMSCRGGVWACGAPCWTDCELLFVGFPPALCCSFASKWSRNAGLYCVLLLPVLPRAATSTQLIHLLSSYSNNILIHLNQWFHQWISASVLTIYLSDIYRYICQAMNICTYPYSELRHHLSGYSALFIWMKAILLANLLC